MNPCISILPSFLLHINIPTQHNIPYNFFYTLVDVYRYNPYSQTRGRVDQLKRLGHSVDKVEFIVMGGTFMSLDTSYKDYFIRNLHDALSGHHSSSGECIHRVIKSNPYTIIHFTLFYSIFIYNTHI